MPEQPRQLVDNAWREVLALIGTIEPDELIDPTIEPERLLYRLFHEHGVRVFAGVQVADECSCSRERIRGILEGFSAEEIAESTEDGVIRVNCEFCSKGYEFDPAEFVAVELSGFSSLPDRGRGGLRSKPEWGCFFLRG